MIPAIEALAILMIGLLAILLYRRLIRSPRFTKLIGGMVPPPETGDEALKNLASAEQVARSLADQAVKTAYEQRQTAVKIKRQVRRKPTPF